MAGDAFDVTRATYDLITEDSEVRSASIPPEYMVSRDAFVDLMRPGALVADLGCGPGRDAAHFAADAPRGGR